MINQSYHVILFIDDHSSNYLPALEPAARAIGFELFATNSVLDGLDFLKEYKEAISAVILDLSFPKGEMQGLEALRIIKQSRPALPVIMLTDSDSASDIDIVVECMKNGAFNYIGKRTLNSIYLFQVIESAIKQAKILVHLNSIKKNPENGHRFFTEKSDCAYGRYKKSALFGFELISVNKPKNELEKAQLEYDALLWHKNLLESISVVYRDELQLNLKFISLEAEIKCTIIISVFATSDAGLQEIISNIQHDVFVFFSSKIDFTHPYLFQEIKDSEVLLNSNNYSDEYKYHVFFRSPIKVHDKKNIGFNYKSTSPSVQNCNELFGLPSQINFDNGLFKAMINLNDYAEIDVQIIPYQLIKIEIDTINNVIKDSSLINCDDIKYNEITSYVNYAQKFISEYSNKFLISLVLKHKSHNWNQNLKSGIQNYFFGLDANVKYQSRKHSELFRYSTSNKGILQNHIPFLYTIDEAIQMFRLPMPGAKEIPGIEFRSHNFYFHPSNLSKEGILLGIKNNVDSEKPIRIDSDSLSRHLYIMGQTGTGKSTMLKTMILDCLKNNNGFTIIDPHGDLYDQILKLIPKSKKGKVNILDISDPENSIKINPLEYDDSKPQSKSLAINEILRAFSTLYDMELVGGPAFESYFKNALLLIMDEKVREEIGNSTLSDVTNVFLDDDFRKERLKICANKSVTLFFKNAEARTGDVGFANIANYVTSKLTRFVEDYYLAPILTSQKNNINFRKLIDDGNILLVKMDKGLIGSDNASLLGQLLLSKLFLAGMSRSNICIEDRIPHFVFIDEFHNFIKSDVSTALSEVRKYGLKLILANQTMGQLDETFIQSLLGNVGSLIFFRPGIFDYDKIKYYLEPEFSREEILKLPNHNCVARLMIDNVPSDPFVFQTIKY